MLLCNFGNLEDEIRPLESAGAAALHLDVMDGHFVPNLTYGMPIVAACHQLTDLVLDVHLMIQEPERYIEQFGAAGASCLTIHVEAVPNPRTLLERIRSLDAAAGLALNPETPLSAVADCLDACDLVLPMSVSPGFGGQAFNPVALAKLRELRRLGGPNLLLEVDGGINHSTVRSCAEAGATLFVVGSAIFGSGDYSQSIDQLLRLAEPV
jgi:ribulose-phosphate 3-epimerase